MGNTVQEAKDALGRLMQAEPTKERKAALVQAEQACIAYYYDILEAQAVKSLTGQGGIMDVDIAPVQDAVRKVNQACANQKSKYLFGGDINSRKDLFQFAKEIAETKPAATAPQP